MTAKLQCCICNYSGNQGIVIHNQYICRNCEKELIKPDLDELKYTYFKKKLKLIWKTKAFKYNKGLIG